MSVTIPSTVPERFTAGDTVRFTRAFDGYSSADGWTYAIYIAGAQTLSAAGVANAEGGWDVTIPAGTAAGQSGSLDAGGYQYIERVSKVSPAETYTLGSGLITVDLNLATAAAGDAQSHEEKTLSVLEAALSGRLTKDIQSYQIAGRAVNKIPISELRKLYKDYRIAVARQRSGGAPSRTIKVQFGSDSIPVGPWYGGGL